MLHRIKGFVEKHQMIEAGDHILVGVSGGADSVCLLRILAELQRDMDFSLEAIHVEHGIRGEESLGDARFTRSLCEELGIGCRVVSVDVPAYAKKMGLGHEEAARILRYEVFFNVAREGKQQGDAVVEAPDFSGGVSVYAERGKAGRIRIALAHHMEDQTETVLFQMVRGSGLRGMCGISPVRRDEEGVFYIRPLLCVSRGEIEEYLKDLGQDYCVDSTNLELEYTRNKLRHQVIPQLKAINPQAVAHMNQSAEQLRLVWDYMRQQVEGELERIWLSEEPYTIHGDALGGVHPALQTMLAHEILAKVAGKRKDISSVHVKDLIGLARGNSGRQLHLPYGIRARKEYERIIFEVSGNEKVPGEQKHPGEQQLKEEQKHPGEQQLREEQKHSGEQQLKEEQKLMWNRKVEGLKKAMKAPEQEIEISKQELLELEKGSERRIFLGQESAYLVLRHGAFHGEMEKIPKNHCTKWFDYDMIKNGFQLRKRKSGDYFVNDSKGHHKKLKQYFIDEKIPASVRDRLWLVTMASEVVWVVGGRMSEAFKVTEKTREILQIEYVEGSANGFYKRL